MARRTLNTHRVLPDIKFALVQEAKRRKTSPGSLSEHAILCWLALHARDPKARARMRKLLDAYYDDAEGSTLPRWVKKKAKAAR